MFQTDALPIPHSFSEQGPLAALIYVALHEATRPLTVDEISEAVTRPVSYVRRVARDLANAELVERRTDHHDNRRYVYDLPAEI